MDSGGCGGGFGAIISEVGAAMMVGGNLAGETRVMTTAMSNSRAWGLRGALALDRGAHVDRHRREHSHHVDADVSRKVGGAGSMNSGLALLGEGPAQVV